ncbi:hypothetical protein KI387_024933, partial [Taxus chinensis]
EQSRSYNYGSGIYLFLFILGSPLPYHPDSRNSSNYLGAREEEFSVRFLFGVNSIKMGGLRKAFVVFAFAALVMTASMPMAAVAQNCNTVLQAVAPCLVFLQTNGAGQPSGQCCSGVTRLAGTATTSPAKRQICNCIKSQINNYPQVTDTAVSNLPSKCNSNIGFKISKSTNCNT